MTFLEPQRAARRGGHRLVDAGRTPNGLHRMLVCELCGGKILARTPEEAGGDIAMWSCSPREARETDRQQCDSYRLMRRAARRAAAHDGADLPSACGERA